MQRLASNMFTMRQRISLAIAFGTIYIDAAGKGRIQRFCGGAIRDITAYYNKSKDLTADATRRIPRIGIER